MNLKENPFNAWYSNGKITITGTATTGARAALYDLQGRKLMETRLEDTRRNNFEVAGMKNGVYLLRIFSGEKYHTLKVPVISEN